MQPLAACFILYSIHAQISYSTASKLTQAWSPQAICLIFTMQVKALLEGWLKDVLWLYCTNVWHTCMTQKCQLGSDSSSLRGRCRPSRAWLKSKSTTGDGCVCLNVCVCVHTHASSYLMPRHSWMIPTWLRMKIGLSHYYDSSLLCWSCVVPGRLEGHILIFFISSLFLVMFSKKTSSEPNCENLYIHSSLKLWPWPVPSSSNMCMCWCPERRYKD